MSDHPKSTALPPDDPAPAWEDAPAFREVFLAQFPPEVADAFRKAGRALYDAALDGDFRVLLTPWVHAHVRALAADLRITGEVFASLADAREEAGLSIAEHQLATRCALWAGEVAALVLNIEGALDSEPER